MYIASISPDIAFAAKAARAGKNRPPDTHSLIEDIRPLVRTQYAEGFPRQFLQPQDGHPAPARSSQLSLREPPWKKIGPSPSQGQTSARQRPWCRHVTRGPPPTTPLGGWSPQAPTTAREAKKRPSAAPRCPNQNQKPNQKTTDSWWSSLDRIRSVLVVVVVVYLYVALYL